MPRDIRAVIFDLDGLLLDTEPILRRVDTELVERHGRALPANLRQRTLGLTREAKDRLLVQELQLPVAPQILTTDSAALLETLWPTAQLMPGAG